mgnify:CR=1 FL=1
MRQPVKHSTRRQRSAGLEITRAIELYYGYELSIDCQVQVLSSLFFRNKGAYIIGRLINGNQMHGFVIPVLHNRSGEMYLDTVLTDTSQLTLLFSFTRAYFMVDMEVPSGYVQFLRAIMPNKPRSEIYIMLGLGKQGKTMFFRDFIYHLHHSEDKFIMAPGIRGLVMLVFTLPSYPYVFKIIKDVFGASKNMDRATVKRKFMMVKQVDRVGRLADTLALTEADHAAKAAAGEAPPCAGVPRPPDREWSMCERGLSRSPASADSPWPTTHSGSGPSIGRPVKNFAAMQPPRQPS